MSDYSFLAWGIGVGGCLLILLWTLFHRKRRRSEFPAETWEPYLDSGDRYNTENTEEGIEMISGEGRGDRNVRVSATGVSVHSRLQALENLSPEVKEGKSFDSQQREEVSFDRAEEVPAQIPASGLSEELEPHSPDGPQGEKEPNERESASATSGEEEAHSPLISGRMEGNDNPPDEFTEGLSPWWKNIEAPKNKPFRRGVAELMGVTVLDSVAGLEALEGKSVSLPVEAEKPETETEGEPVGSGHAREEGTDPEPESAVSVNEPSEFNSLQEEYPVKPDKEDAAAPTTEFSVNDPAKTFDREDPKEYREDAFVLDSDEEPAEEDQSAASLEGVSHPSVFDETMPEDEEKSPEGLKEEPSEEPVEPQEVGDDVFRVISEERNEASEPSLESDELFDEMEEEGAGPSVEEVPYRETKEAVSLEGIVEEALSSEPMDISPPSVISEDKVADSPEAREPVPEEVPAAEEKSEEDTLPLPGGPPLEVVRELVAAICPTDMLLIEEVPDRIPAGAEDVSAAAWKELREQMDDHRKAVDPQDFLRLGILDQVLGRHDEAMVRLKEALRRTDRMGPVLNAMAVASFLRGKIDPAISYCKEAVRESGSDTVLSAAVHRNLGFLHQQRGDHRQAAEAIVASIRNSGMDEHPKILGELHLRAGQLFRKLGEMENAQKHFSESAEFFGNSGDEIFRVRSLVALAAAQTEQGEMDNALKNLDEANRVCERLDDKAGEALILGQMGIAYSAQDQYTRAIEHFEKALALNRDLGNRRGEGANLSNIGNIHYFRGDLAEAQAAYEMALEINREQEHLIGQATILGNLGRIHLESGENDIARERLRESLDIFRTAGAKNQVERVHEILEEIERSRSS